MAAAVALVLFVVTYWAFVTTGVGQSLENLAVRGAQLRSTETRGASLELLSPISVLAFGLAITITFLVAVLRRRLALGAMAVGVMVTSVVAAELLKEVLPRPVFEPGPSWILRNSFPSGSAAVATAVAIGCLLVAPDRLRWLVLAAGTLAVAIIGDAVQTAGWHRLSDTIGGTLLVIGVASGGLAVLARMGLVQETQHGRVPRSVWIVLALLALAVLILATLVIVILLAFPLLGAPEGGRRAFLQTAFPLFGAGSTILAMLVFGRVIEPLSLGQGGSDRTAAEPGPTSGSLQP
ncbi:MAG: phosphatase PAP2 family protein [Chloroflexota bacterium]